MDDIGEAKRQRAQFEAGVRAIAEGHLKLLDAFRDAPPEATVEYLGAKKKTADEK